MDPSSRDEPDFADVSADALDDAITMPPPIPDARRNSKDVFVSSGPPPVADAKSAPADLLRQIHVAPRDDRGEHRRESASWAGSILAHAGLLLLIMMIIVPADLGGAGTFVIRLTLSDRDQALDDKPALVEIVAVEKEQVTEEPEPEVPEPEPEKEDQEQVAVAPVVASGTAGTETATSGGEGADAARGSFFGIDADGYEFVYVLDRSGSMKGIRFRRAAKELMRSVESLNENQSFYVVLFNTGSYQLFNQKSFSPKAIPATRENKNRLARWLNATYPSGGTDPRRALSLALRMNPSAVFMLSDGEFRDDKKGRGNGLFDDNADTRQLVKQFGDKVPIHAIAYEDPNSCRNMRELAELSGGDYQFVKLARADEADLLKMADKAMAQGDSRLRENSIVELADEFTMGNVSLDAKAKYAEMLFEVADSALADNRPEDALVALQKYRGLDPRSKLAAERRGKLIERIVARLEQSQDPDEVLMICDYLQGFQNTEESQEMVESVLDALFAAAEEKPVEAYRTILNFSSRYRNTDLGERCKLECQAIVDRFNADARQLIAKGDRGAALRELSASAARARGSAMYSVMEKSFMSLANEMLAEARDAGLSRNLRLKEKINGELETAVADPRILQRIRTTFTANELQARKLMRGATKMLRTAKPEQAKQVLETIVRRYPVTLTADKAKAELIKIASAEPKQEADEEKNVMLYLAPEINARRRP